MLPGLLQGPESHEHARSDSVQTWLARAEAFETEGRLGEAVRALHAANRVAPAVATERRLVRLRRAAFSQHGAPPARPALPGPLAPPPLDPVVGLPVVPAEAVTADVIRSAIAAHGSLVVRGLVGAAAVTRLRAAIDQAFAARKAIEAGGEADPCWYDELEDIPDGGGRAFTSHGGVLAGDSPRGLFEMLDSFYEIGIDRLVAEYLCEPAALSFEKTTLRRVAPSEWPASWHQDGAFLGAEIRSLNVWTSLSRCGRDAPGLEIVPRRFDGVLPTGAYFDWDVSEATIERAAPGVRPANPEFEAGDVMFFDHLCVHRTSQLQGMTHDRYAIESWFFSPSAYPKGSTGIHV